MSDVFFEVLKGIMTPVLSGIGSLAIGYLIWGRKKIRSEAATYDNTYFKNQAEASDIYLKRLGISTETINKLSEANLKITHESNKKTIHIMEVVDAVERHLNSCSSPEDELLLLIALLKDRYVKR